MICTSPHFLFDLLVCLSAPGWLCFLHTVLAIPSTPGLLPAGSLALPGMLSFISEAQLFTRMSPSQGGPPVLSIPCTSLCAAPQCLSDHSTQHLTSLTSLLSTVFPSGVYVAPGSTSLLCSALSASHVVTFTPSSLSGHNLYIDVRSWLGKELREPSPFFILPVPGYQTFFLLRSSNPALAWEDDLLLDLAEKSLVTTLESAHPTPALSASLPPFCPNLVLGRLTVPPSSCPHDSTSLTPNIHSPSYLGDASLAPHSPTFYPFCVSPSFKI